MIFDLSGTSALVTGASGGIGGAIARALHERGAEVVISGTRRDALENLAGELGDRVHVITADLADAASVDGLAGQAEAAADGGIDILVNNAGVGQMVTPVVELGDGEWDRVIGVTLTGTFYCCRAAGRIMERQESGAIVNISSINGQNPAALVAAYNAAKEGVISLTRTLALELAAYGVRVNAVCPGPVYTEFNRSNMAQRSKTLGLTEEELIERIRSAIPLGRWGEVEDIAQGWRSSAAPRRAGSPEKSCA